MMTRDERLKRKREYYRKNRESILADKKVYTEQHKERIRIKSQEWRDKNPERSLESCRRYREKNPCCPTRQKDSTLRCRYGITLEDFNCLFKKQDGKCAICRQGKKLCVDRCHESGKVRGLLCRECNIAIALLDDDVINLARASYYLMESKCEKTTQS